MSLVILFGNNVQQDLLRAKLHVIAEKSLSIVLPQDDALLRQLLAYEIQTDGEVQALVQWAPKLVSTELYCFVIQQGSSLSDVVSSLGDVYVSPNAVAAASQIKLLFPQVQSSQAVQSPVKAALTPFKARPAPSTRPSIQPRLSKAAALRMGVAYQPSVTSSPRSATPASPIKMKPNASMGISGLPRSEPKLPASLKAPSIVPRLNKVASTRTGAPITAPAAMQRKVVDYSNTPGHKRHSSISTATITSTATPSIQPRQNRASMSRIDHTSAPTARLPQAAGPRKEVDYAATPGHKRHSLALAKITALQTPTMLPRQNRTSLARTHKLTPAENKENTEAVLPTRTDYSHVPGHKRQYLNFSVASLKTPLIQPRLNKAADVRIGVAASHPPSS